MEAFLQHAALAQSAAGLSGRRLCRRSGLSRATYLRWRHRHGCGRPLRQRPGPPKTGPLPLARVRQELQQLEHGAHRTRGTGAVYQQYRGTLSRRELARLVREERHQQQQQERAQLQQIIWFSVHSAWALDATEWPTAQPEVKLQVLAARDLASNYGLGLWAGRQLRGGSVAEYVAGLFRRYGPPLFLKRDNGAVLHTPEVEQVLAEAAVLPLDSPAYYPRYNGAMEKHIGDLKRLFPYPLPECCAVELSAAQALVEAILLEANARPREALEGCSPTEFFHAAPDLHVDRRTRADIFASLLDATERKLATMKSPHLRGATSAWRSAVQQWLLDQQLIALSTHIPSDNQNQLLLPLFSKKWPH